MVYIAKKKIKFFVGTLFLFFVSLIFKESFSQKNSLIVPRANADEPICASGYTAQQCYNYFVNGDSGGDGCCDPGSPSENASATDGGYCDSSTCVDS